MSSNTCSVSISIEDGIHIIRFDSPSKRNAIQRKSYEVMTKSLKDAANNPDVYMSVLTGRGEYYSSGFDMSQASDISDDPEVALSNGLALLQKFVDTLIDYPKLLVAVVNGPAIGVAVTTLGLCDIVYASENATFQTPFSTLGLCAEGCASYTFPRILGKSKANEMLLTSYKLSAEEAHKYGLVAQVVKHSDLPKLWGKFAQFKDLSLNSILLSKQMSKKYDTANLHAINKIEIDNVKKCFASEDFLNALIKFLSKKNKL